MEILEHIGLFKNKNSTNEMQLGLTVINLFLPFFLFSRIMAESFPNFKKKL